MEQDDFVSKDSIFQKLDISLSTLKRYALSLNEDLQAIKEFNQMKIIDKRGEYRFDNATPFNGYYVIKKMNLSYYSNSLNFQLLQKVFSSSIKHLSDLPEMLCISLPYVYKLLLEANQFLAPFHIKIEYSKKLDNIFISGSATNIRLFETYFFWNVNQGIEWPFENITLDEVYQCFTEDELKFIFNLSVSKQSKYLYSLAVIHRFFPSKQAALKLEEPFLETLSVFRSNTDLSRPLVQLLNTSYPLINDPEKMNMESLFFNLMGRVFSSYRDSEEIQLDIGKELFLLNNELIDYCKQLISSLLIEFPKLKQNSDYNETRYKLLYFFSLYFANIFYIHFDSSNMSEFMPISSEIQSLQSPLFIKGKDFFDRFIVEHPLTKDKVITDFHMSLIYNLIYSFISQVEKTHLTAYIQFSKDMFGESYIHNQLYKLFGKENIMVVDHITDADIIISDFYEYRYKEENYFYFDAVDNKASWSKLFNFVHKHQIESIS
ncbi:helix-turn-helix domain-containing protein [Carnobacterium gallinarum]|uniref:helix-turn-helix domain-containing protein n=1 Tax=Carnobacterium gallinarum TaxID=2749 RepID=UPI00147064C8|nr:helix-turn-helix domain-containing protein [Carnobacterium gallinarum]